MTEPNIASQAAEVSACFRTAAGQNRKDPLLRGSVMIFPERGDLIMTGDMHGHRRNFAKLQRYSDLANHPERHVILHELIHQEPERPGDYDTSHELLLAAARWKCEFPNQIHFLQSNHELSQLTGHEISKAGRIVTEDFEDAIQAAYGNGFIDVLKSIADFIESFPLAGRTPNRIFLSHSLPGQREFDYFDTTIFNRRPTAGDMHDGGSAYALVWGRYQTVDIVEELAIKLEVDAFICGHQPQESGYDILHDRMMIIASDHDRGVLLPIDLTRPYTMRQLESAIQPFSQL